MNERDATDELYQAVGKYVKTQGGIAMLATGVQIQQWPDAKKGEYLVAVKVIGRPPEFEEPTNDR